MKKKLTNIKKILAKLLYFKSVIIFSNIVLSFIFVVLAESTTDSNNKQVANIINFINKHSVIIGIIISIIGIFISTILFLISKKRKSMSYEILNKTPLLSIDKLVKDDIEIKFKGTVIDELIYLVLIKVFNNGNIAIKKKLYVN